MRSPRQRFWGPVLVLGLIWLAADLLLAAGTQAPYGPANPSLYRLWMNLLSGTRFGLLLLGTLLLYPIFYFRGAPLRERILGSLILPLVYMVTAMIRSTAFFPTGQAIYYGLNSLTFGSLFLQVGLIGAAEMGCRAWLRWRRRQPVTVFGWPWAAAILVGGVAIFLTLFWEGGVHWFYVYQEGFKLLFQ